VSMEGGDLDLDDPSDPNDPPVNEEITK